MTTTKTTKALKANGFKRITVRSVVNWEKQRMLGTKKDMEYSSDELGYRVETEKGSVYFSVEVVNAFDKDEMFNTYRSIIKVFDLYNIKKKNTEKPSCAFLFIEKTK